MHCSCVKCYYAHGGRLDRPTGLCGWGLRVGYEKASSLLQSGQYGVSCPPPVSERYLGPLFFGILYYYARPNICFT